MDKSERKKIMQKLALVRRHNAPPMQVHKRKNRPKRKNVRAKLRRLKNLYNRGSFDE